MFGLTTRWSALAVMLAALGCGTTDDDRPRDAQYITEAILAPTCGGVGCHSTFSQENGVVLDTYDAMRTTMIYHPLLSFQSDDYDPADPDDAVLIIWLTQTDPFGRGIGRMPYDAPMPNADVDLLKAWITGPIQKLDDHAACQIGVTACPAESDTCVTDGSATTGECFAISYPDPAHGAACDPTATSGLSCNGVVLTQCNADWSFGSAVQTCDSDCVEGACTD